MSKLQFSQVAPMNLHYMYYPLEYFLDSMVRESLSLLAKRAEELNANLVMEPVLPDETNLVYNVETAKKMLDEVDSPRLGINVDTVPMEKAGNTLSPVF